MPTQAAPTSHRPFRILLGALLAFLTLAPLAARGPFAVATLQVLLSGLVGAVLLVLRGRPRRRMFTVFVVGTLVLLWSAGITPSRPQAALTLAALLGLQVLAFVVVVRALVEAEEVSIDTVLGAALGYLLMGLVFAFLYGFFAIAVPGSMPVGHGGDGPMPSLLEAGRVFPDLLYFSFTTLSTLGYAELTPTHPFVRSLSSLEALLGELYLAVLVARLVGLHLVQETQVSRTVDTHSPQQETRRMNTRTLCFALGAALTLLGGAELAAQSEGDDRPNFIVIVADDMGFSDIGMFGGEIPTPRLDQLAQRGIRYTNFYVAPSCSPTRSMLLTGTDHHLAGLGAMYERTAPNQEGQPGYEGVLNDRVAPVSALLKDAGYHTYMAGKWHLGKDPERIPAARGFERDFTMLAAAGSHFDMTGNNWEVPDNQFTEDGEYITELPDDYYSTKTFTDKIIEQIESNREDGQPFFAYLAHMAPHEPLQVPDGWLRRHKGRYDCGWDSVRAQRMGHLKELGLIREEAELAHRMWFIPEFNAMTGLARYSVARKMEIYASMVEYMDMEIGRLVDYLDRTGELDNTYIIFFSDNGPETQDKTAQALQRPQSQAAGWLANDYTTDFAHWGRSNSHMGYGMPWAQVSATPFYLAKGSMGEGGIRAPLIVVPPRSNTGGAINTDAILHVKDITPTILEIAGVEHPATFAGREVHPMQGKSWVPMLAGDVRSVRTDDDWLGFEFWGMRAVRQGPWKALWMHEPFGTEEWELYDVDRDPGERVNRAQEQPAVLRRLVSLWDQYASENGVILPDRHQYEGMEENLPPRPAVLGSWPPGSEENWGEEEDTEYFQCTVKKR